jgi:hypothetical protein
VALGVIRQTGTYQRMTFGELDGRTSERGQQLRDLREAAGFDGALRARTSWSRTGKKFILA